MTRKLYGNELHPVYSRYRAIKNRCEDPKHTSYPNYGARGIKLSNELQPFENFRDYVVNLDGYNPKDLTLDRIDPDKGYEKGNLRWVDMSTQIAAQRESGKGFNNYTGVNWSKTHNRWIARINFKGKSIFTKSCLTEEDALKERNKFITENNLPHKIQEWSS